LRQLAARPVVATRVGSVAEAVSNGETGILVDKEDVDGLVWRAATIRRCASASVGAVGRAITHFTVEHMVDRYERLWHEVVSARKFPGFASRPENELKPKYLSLARVSLI